MQQKITNYEPFYFDSLQKGVDFAAAHTLALGFDSVELLATSPIFPFTEKELKHALSANGLPVTCFSVGLNLYAETESERRAAEATLCGFAETAALLGSPILHHTLLTPVALWEGAPDFSAVLSPVLDSAERVARHCEALGLACIYEPQGMFFNGEGFSLFFDEMKKRAANVGICGDVGNPLFVDADPKALFAKHAADIKHVHLKNYRIADEPFKTGKCYPSRAGRYLQNAPLSEGALDLAAILAPLGKAGYMGAFALEVSGEDAAVLRDIACARSLLSAFDKK